MSRTKHAI